MDNKQILAELSNARKKKAEPLVINVLLDMFQKDLPVNDADYVDRRLKQVVDEFVGKIDYKNPEVAAATKKLLHAIRKNWKQWLPAKQEWRQKKLDKTEQRNARCEPVVFAILEDLFKDDLILSDEEYLDEAIKEQSKMLFHALIYGYMAEISGELEMSLNNSLDIATKFLWGGKEKEEITAKQVDKILKSQKEVAPNKE